MTYVERVYLWINSSFDVIIIFGISIITNSRKLISHKGIALHAPIC